MVGYGDPSRPVAVYVTGLLLDDWKISTASLHVSGIDCPATPTLPSRLDLLDI